MRQASIRLTRRGMLALFVALGLAIMHGGIGQAMVCGNSMAPMTSMTSPVLAMSANSSADTHSEHHQPADQPITSHSASMCVSTPALVGGDGKAPSGSSQLAFPASVALATQHVATVGDTTSWHPPAPDLISVFCLIRQ